jgi:diguanylate cyclase (GGDEF)-like protein/PAS domain S-box-containing protein
MQPGFWITPVPVPGRAMVMTNISPTTRITLGLVLIMMSIFLLSDMIGLFPNRADAIIKGRTNLAESLAVQYSIAAQKRNAPAIKAGMRLLVQKNDDVLSAALRETSGRLLAISGEHDKYWTTTGDASTPTNIAVPIYKGLRRWGTVELSFAPLHTKGIFGFHINPLVQMALFITITGFAAFLFFIKRTHIQIDTGKIVPSRVTNALNALAEGVLLLDSDGRIMLANTAFGEAMKLKPAKLLGKKASGLGWKFINSRETEHPWTTAIQSGINQTGKQLSFTDKSGEKRTFVVNCSPVIDEEGENRGVLATFDDVTQLEEKNDQLENMLDTLKKSRDEVKSKNDKLHILATRDSMTNCLNRRSFFEKYEPVFKTARKSSHHLTCIMADIDLFKSINDNFGHGLGDEVIISVAGSLQNSIRSSDTVCRYGGEEFCIVLPDTSLDDAMKAAERAQKTIASTEIQDEPKIKITASFGIATLNEDTETLSELIDQADKALYASKNNGRNRVTAWDQCAENNAQDTDSPIEPGVSESSSQHATASASPAGDGRDFTRPTGEAEVKPEHDSLTGLPNRRIFHDSVMHAVKHCRDTGQFMAVMMLDIDMFKRINNALGYKAGDELLLTISRRLQSSLRKSDSITQLTSDETAISIYRLGGDEFGILLSGMDCVELAEQIVKRIIDRVTEPLEIDENEIHLTCSMGITLFPGSANDTDGLLKNTAMALYQAKRQVHKTYQFYDEDLHNISRENMELENDLRHAIERNELKLYYQPKIELLPGKITGMEALLRWKHPTIGMIPPNEFIPLAEETGLIHEIGEWVLHTACNKLKEWESTGNKDISVAVNLSAIQFQQKDLLEMIRETLRDTGANPKLLELEITESMIMDNIDSASTIMSKLHKEGVQISIDDFGTGYSSLNHLKRFPISTVKIDRSFVRDLTTDLGDAAIVAAIITMAHGMGMKIIAEGVETEQQLEYLRRLRCDVIQGFLFSPALPEDEVEELLKKDKDGTAFPDTQLRAAS